jgi:hypothetical protein
MWHQSTQLTRSYIIVEAIVVEHCWCREVRLEVHQPQPWQSWCLLATIFNRTRHCSMYRSNLRLVRELIYSNLQKIYGKSLHVFCSMEGNRHVSNDTSRIVRSTFPLRYEYLTYRRKEMPIRWLPTHPSPRFHDEPHETRTCLHQLTSAIYIRLPSP